MSVDASQPQTTDRGVSREEEIERLIRFVRAAMEKNAQLEHALESRIAIEQAKGVLRERLGIETDEAFELVRRAARNHRIRLHELAARVVEEPQTPAEIAELLGERA